ncbi:zinc ribbon domain-containing protein [Evansella sp. AB-P1]|uniref:zinc ribbon domain-containing protein n=1 Tax=Evansella sp. AB-P1 TaxID=3037653 RepID=UPI00241D7623|nr:zinc ribbon domain-containing protein [Evansella sp. AB-P1]MDG5789360.1 zinc ribbon domain-containing protein [Evansella sp. AB-P1]
MDCPKCGNLVEEGANFCLKCGCSLNESSDEVAATAQETEQKSGEPNPYIEKVKTGSMNYWKFFVEMLKSPTSKVNSVVKSDFLNGSITLVLLSIFLPLIVFTHIKVQFGQFVNVSFFDTVVSPFFYILIFITITSFVIFAVTKFFNQSSLTFFDVVAKFGAYNIVSICFFLGAFVFAIIKAVSFSMYFISFGLLSFIVTIALTLYSLKKDEKATRVDPIYGAFIVYLALAIVLLIIGESFLYQMNQMLWRF